MRLTVFYASSADLVSPHTLDPASPPQNQQYRIDVMRKNAPLDSLQKRHILAKVFRTKGGDPQDLAPKRVTADLTELAGRTVRLRAVEVDNRFFMCPGLDAVKIRAWG
jgi:DNA topoisomerase IB